MMGSVCVAVLPRLPLLHIISNVCHWGEIEMKESDGLRYLTVHSVDRYISPTRKELNFVIISAILNVETADISIQQRF
ncbi:unnamed protein product [Medioppia subpectinata]|uniref:Uncharacterized protein n=1 Tax=Medioppia subpectinata TaxID=1979941 RepID=A0A7R9KGT7_9ACAR|nr:unnamed protein product [Medioppia subpectinata]CAG2103112.1 unnamed protein product [Medioppia subpectinata]